MTTTWVGQGSDMARARLYEKAWSDFRTSSVSQEGAFVPAPQRFVWTGTQLSCLIRLEGASPELLAAIRREQRALLRYAGVMVHPRYFLHMTVRMFGEAEESCHGAACEVRDRAGVSVSSSEIDVTLREALAGTPACPITFRGLNSWREAPFLQVFDGGGISRIRGRISQALSEIEDREYADGFVPHLTLGYYCDGADLPAIAAYIGTRRDVFMGELVPRAVEMVWSRGGTPYPQLITIGRYPLVGDGR